MPNFKKYQYVNKIKQILINLLVRIDIKFYITFLNIASKEKKLKKRKL